MNKNTVIHLVSDQTMQNVLPILAIEPQRVVQVLSFDSERFLNAAENTRRAVREAGKLGFQVPADWPEPISIGMDSPTIEQSRAIFDSAIRDHPGAWVNYTGGTKNMSIGAWLASCDAKANSLYCDTPGEFFPGIPGGELPTRSLREVATKLTVPLILASQGLHKGEHWARRGISPGEEKLGEVAFLLSQQYGEPFRAYRYSLLLHALPKNGARARAADVERVTCQPVPAPENPDFAKFLEGAVEAGLLESEAGLYFYRINRKKTPFEQQKQLDRAAQGISGSAFEAYVAMLLKTGSRFTQFLSNVYPAGHAPEEHGFGETDFIAYSPEAVSITLISCKTSPPRLEHLESLLARKAKFGGLHAKTLLCVETGANRKRESDLRAQCASLGISCAIGDDIQSALGA